MEELPRNEHALELALNRLAGSNIKAVEYRDIMAGVVLGQMLPDGCVVKGGTSMRLRFGPGRSRVTMDFDTSRRDDLDIYLKQLRERTERGWQGFTGEVLIRKQGSPKGIPFEYVMQPLDVKLAYRHQPWCTIRLEVSHNELGDADEVEHCDLPADIVNIFTSLGFPVPNAIPLMPLPFQIAQKLHGLSSQGSNRARDLIDLQLLLAGAKVDLNATASVCNRLFAYRKMQPWPPTIAKGDGWNSLYDAQRGTLPVLATAEEAVAWVNDLIGKLSQCGQ